MLNKELLTVDEVAEILRTTQNTIYRWLRSGKISGVKIGKEWRIKKTTLDTMIENPVVVPARKNYLDKIGPEHDHVMVVTSSICDLYDLEADFFRKGISLGHRLFKGCWWQHPEDARKELTTRGIPVQDLEKGNELVIINLYKQYKYQGIAAPVKSWSDEAKKTLTLGYTTMWGSGSPHLFSCDGDVSKIIGFEDQLNYVLKSLPVVGICPYIFEEGPKTFLAPFIELANHHNSVVFYESKKAVYLESNP